MLDFSLVVTVDPHAWKWYRTHCDHLIAPSHYPDEFFKESTTAVEFSEPIDTRAPTGRKSGKTSLAPIRSAEVGDQQVVCHEAAFRRLFTFCHNKDCGQPLDPSTVHIMSSAGMSTKVEYTCACSTKPISWDSQLKLPNRPG